MKHIPISLVSIASFVLLAITGCETQTSTSIPRQLPSLYSVSFVNHMEGFVGGQGIVLSTNDGGKSWSRSYSGQASIYGFDMLNSRVGWAVGTKGFLKTDNGGRSWRGAGDQQLQFASIDFVNGQSGWGIKYLNSGIMLGFPLSVNNPTELVHTIDGGRHWVTVKGMGNADSVHFISPMTGWVAGSRQLLQTTNGGRTWTSLFTFPDHMTSSWIIPINRQVIWALTNGMAVAGSQPYALWRSVDGGHQWTPVTRSWITSFANIKVPEASGGEIGTWVVSESSTAYLVGYDPIGKGAYFFGRTLNGGKRWTNLGKIHGLTLYGNNTEQPISLFFISPMDGWMAVTQDGAGRIYATKDGGVEWKRIEPW